MLKYSEFIAENHEWKFGSGHAPKSDFDSTPFPEHDSLGHLKKNRYEAEDKDQHKVYHVPVKHLHAWQRGVDSKKIRPLEKDYPPIKVHQIHGKLVIANGNHRAASAFVHGHEYIKAHVTNFDDKKNRKYRKDKQEEKPLHAGVKEAE